MVEAGRLSLAEHLLTLYTPGGGDGVITEGTNTKTAIIVEKKNSCMTKQKIAEHHRQKLCYLVSPPTRLSPMMSHSTFSINPCQVLDTLLYSLLTVNFHLIR